MTLISPNEVVCPLLQDFIECLDETAESYRKILSKLSSNFGPASEEEIVLYFKLEMLYLKTDSCLAHASKNRCDDL